MKAQLERIFNSPEASFNAFMYRNIEFKTPWHFHPELELTYIVTSDGIRYVGDSVMEFEEGDLVLLGPNLPHCWKNTDVENQLASSIVLQWPKDVLGDHWIQKSEFTSIRELISRSSCGIKFNRSISSEIAPLLYQILEEAPFEKVLLLLRILQRLASTDDYELLSSEDLPTIDLKASERIENIYNFVSENYRRKITLKEVADVVSLAEESFCRFFYKIFNKTFFTFLNEYKIKLACKLLIETDLQVSEIAYQCGYESLPFFYRQFKRCMGYSPLCYRKKFERAIQV